MRNGLLVFLIVLIYLNGAAQTVDGSYKPEILTNGYIYDIAALPDGKFIVGGDFNQFNSTKQGALIRLNADLTVDETFNTGGSGPTFISGGVEFQGSVRRIERLSDGKLIITGDFYRYNGQPRARIARINADGTLDASFTPPPLPTGSSEFGSSECSVIAQADGKVVFIEGNAQSSGFTRRIIRLNPDGSIDNTFTAISPSSTVFDLGLQSSGKIIVAGAMTSVNGSSLPYLFRVNTNGTVDNSFLIGTGPNGFVEHVTVRTDDKIMISGGYNAINNVAASRFARLNADGTIDNSFQGNSDGALDVAFLQNGQVVTGGGYLTVKKLNSNGSLDKSSVGSADINDRVNKVIVLPDDKILIGTQATGGLNYYVRLNSDLTIDNTFGNPMGPIKPGRVQEMVIQNGKVVLLGGFVYYNGVRKNGIARLNQDLSIDNTYSTGTGFQDLFVPNAAVQDNGSIVLQTQSKVYNGASLPSRIVRLSSQGTIDPGFLATTAFYSNLVKAKDNKIIAYSSFSAYRLVRLNADGTNDNSFLPVFDSEVTIAAPMKNGKVVATGTFTKLNDAAVPQLIRLNENGTRDNTFLSKIEQAGTTYSSILETADGKLLVFGNLRFGPKIYPVMRLLENGDLDPSFALPEDLNNTSARYGAVLADNSIVVMTRNNEILRLYPDGAILPVSPLPSTNGSIKKVAQISTTSFLVAGDFTKVGNSTQLLAKIDFTAAAPPAVPGNVTGTVKGVSIDLSWTASAGSTKYEVESNDGSGFVKAGEPTTNSYTLTNLKEQTSYKVRVRAIGPGGISGYSTEATLITVVGLEAAPSLIAVYPNPVMETLYIDGSVRRAILMDATGRRLAESHGESVGEIDMKERSTGIYLLRLETSEGTHTVRVLKSR